MKEEKKKLTLKEKLKDKRERAKLELLFYGIFFLAIIVFTRILSVYNDVPKLNDTKSFINEITDNYEYNIDINIDNNKYKYYGKRLGNNMSINKVIDNKYDYFYKMGNKYYILDNNGNYILTSVEDIYNYIDYRYLDISNIKEYIKLGTKDNNNYNIKVSDLILNNNNNTNTITISIDELNNTITLDYTELFKIDNNNLNKEIVTIKYTNINKINSLEE